MYVNYKRKSAGFWGWIYFKFSHLHVTVPLEYCACAVSDSSQLPVP